MDKGNLSNNPPYCVLELDKEEYEYLYKLFKKGSEQSGDAFAEMCRMSSENPLSKYRSVLTMAATADKIMHESLSEKLENGK